MDGAVREASLVLSLCSMRTDTLDEGEAVLVALISAPDDDALLGRIDNRLPDSALTGLVRLTSCAYYKTDDQRVTDPTQHSRTRLLNALFA